MQLILTFRFVKAKRTIGRSNHGQGLLLRKVCCFRIDQSMEPKSIAGLVTV